MSSKGPQLYRTRKLSNLSAEMALKVSSEEAKQQVLGMELDAWSHVQTVLQGLRESWADSEAMKKAYCYKQMSRIEAKESESEEDATQLAVEIDQVTLKPARLKEEIKVVGGACRGTGRNGRDLPGDAFGLQDSEDGHGVVLERCSQGFGRPP